MIKNRLEKNFKKLDPWARRIGTEAYRIYDRDIPEFPFILDRYGESFVVYDKSEEIDQGKGHFELFLAAVSEIFKPAPSKIYLKRRERQKGDQQYTRLGNAEEFFFVTEGAAKLRINLSDYLDTGLFLDHRPLRHRLFKETRGKSVLNLFCYTASVSVQAALGGARTTSVDMSGTYIDWAFENFKANNLSVDKLGLKCERESFRSQDSQDSRAKVQTSQTHIIIQDNVLEWLLRPSEQYDVIFLDPPTFSNSKKMEESFDVERDQVQLVRDCMKKLKPDGLLLFSNNKRKFRLSSELIQSFQVKDISESTIPQDFHDKKIHVCFEIHHLG
ncbi:MAG: class I SAM-dependent methyltransferase [Proteobacteria bacterium]|nr:class I SAM-dependent methyltransferase [Pseudomonadota bacterium]